jgi:hypothetical protein
MSLEKRIKFLERILRIGKAVLRTRSLFATRTRAAAESAELEQFTRALGALQWRVESGLATEDERREYAELLEIADQLIAEACREHGLPWVEPKQLE